MKKNKNNILLVLVMIIIAGLSRLLPHPPNFSPITAMAIFGGAYLLNKSYAILIPLVVLFFSDLILNNTSLGYIIDANQFTIFSTYALWIYVPMIIAAILGMRMINKVKIGSVIGYTLLASVIFFLISNFGSFLINPIYSKDASGLLLSYVNGIPFFRNAIMGNLLYSVVLFSAYEWIQNKSFLISPAMAKA